MFELNIPIFCNKLINNKLPENILQLEIVNGTYIHSSEARIRNYIK